MSRAKNKKKSANKLYLGFFTVSLLVSFIMVILYMFYSPKSLIDDTLTYGDKLKAREKNIVQTGEFYIKNK